MNAYKIEDLTLTKYLGKGQFGEVYLGKKGGKDYAVKKIERSLLENESLKKEIIILKNLHHQNIVKFEEIKEDKYYYYIVMEYINGGNLNDCLRKYKKKYGRPFSEEIVQYLMKQIVSGLKYIHNKGVVHRDLKLDNIMIKFYDQNDKTNLNMMKGKIKLIDFGFSTYLQKGQLTYSAIGTKLYCDPLILKKFEQNKSAKSKGYNKEVDIWSLGTLCYKMLIGHDVFEANTCNSLINKVEKGNYHLPTNLSKEVVSFLNGMLQYEGINRLDINQLENHPFLTKNIKDFTKINLGHLSNKIENNQLNINTKLNKSIWAIFNQDDEQKLVNISPKYIEQSVPIQEESSNYQRTNSYNKHNHHNRNNSNQELNKSNTVNYNKYNNNQLVFGQCKNFYGQDMFPNYKSKDNQIDILANIEQKWINEQMNNKISIFEKKNDYNPNKNPFNWQTPNLENNNNIETKNYYNPTNDDENNKEKNACCCCIQ